MTAAIIGLNDESHALASLALRLPMIVLRVNVVGAPVRDTLVFAGMLFSNHSREGHHHNQHNGSSSSSSSSGSGSGSHDDDHEHSDGNELAGDYPILLARAGAAGGSFRTSDVYEGTFLWLQRTFDCRISSLQLSPHMMSTLLPTWAIRGAYSIVIVINDMARVYAHSYAAA